MPDRFAGGDAGFSAGALKVFLGADFSVPTIELFFRELFAYAEPSLLKDVAFFAVPGFFAPSWMFRPLLLPVPWFVREFDLRLFANREVELADPDCPDPGLFDAEFFDAEFLEAEFFDAEFFDEEFLELEAVEPDFFGVKPEVRFFESDALDADVPEADLPEADVLEAIVFDADFFGVALGAVRLVRLLSVLIFFVAVFLPAPLLFFAEAFFNPVGVFFVAVFFAERCGDAFFLADFFTMPLPAFAGDADFLASFPAVFLVAEFFVAVFDFAIIIILMD